MKTFSAIGILLVGAAITGALLYFAEEEKKDPKIILDPLVAVEELRVTEGRAIIHSQGSLSPTEEINLLAEVSGKLIYLAPEFEAGQIFKKGQRLIKIDSRDYFLKVKKTKAQTAEAKQHLLQEEAAVKISIAEWRSLSKGEVPQLIANPSSLQSARTQLALAEASLELAQRDLSRCEIKAPFDGSLKKRLVDVGQVLSPQVSLGQIFSIKSFELRLALSSKDMAYMEQTSNKHDYKVNLHYSLGQKKYQRQALLKRVELMVDERSRSFYAVAEILEPTKKQGSQAPMHLGMFIKAEIEALPMKNLIAVDNYFVKSGHYVWVVNHEDKLSRRSVDLAFESQAKVYVTKGFEKTDRLCLTVLNNMKEGQKVRIK